ncbi:MAG TPA: hypothetical protein VEQ11_19410, partial [Chloroflexota bacterium]|nr:hypothetical protein [Chloroflexota bacterium]
MTAPDHRPVSVRDSDFGAERHLVGERVLTGDVERGGVMEFDTVDGARDAAVAFAAASGGRVVTATMFAQGGRTMFS